MAYQCPKKTKLESLIIEGGSCMNVVLAFTVERLKILVKPHPQPYKVARIDNTHCSNSYKFGMFDLYPPA
jgi:hypothetical protein